MPEPSGELVGNLTLSNVVQAITAHHLAAVPKIASTKLGPPLDAVVNERQVPAPSTPG